MIKLSKFWISYKMVLSKNLLFVLFLFVSFITINDAYSGRDNFFKKNKYCYDNNLGWKFYCDEEDDDKDKEENKKSDKSKDNELSYIDRLNILQKNINEVRARAILEPTEQNVKNYMFLQQKIVNQASYFSDVWRRVLWATPELDYTQQRPVNNVGKNIWQSNRENRIVKTIRDINKRYGLFFVYSTKCIFCQKYSQILYDLGQTYKIEIKGISVDGKFLQGWEGNSFKNTGQLEKLGINYDIVPITILYDNLSNSSILVGYGLMTQDELMGRIYVLTQTKIGEDY